MNTKLGYVSLFSSAGVGCYGFKLEGYDCIVTSELIERRLNIQRHNNVCSIEDHYIAGDITNPEVHGSIFRAIDRWKDVNNKKEVDLIVATPPCQGISVANHKKKNELGRNSLVVESIKIVNQVEPRYFIFENVRGFLNTVCTDLDNINKPIKEAISLNLGGKYNIGFKVLNFKDYGSNSSRTRTLVIGVRKDIEEITPYDLFPEPRKAPNLRELIGDLPALINMGDVYQGDIFHSFRPYKTHMLPWILETKEGESAFDNKDSHKRPHKIVDGKIVENQNKNGDKYKRCYWDSVAPCVHTRNDILASQSTIHPDQPRVFTIRELMRFMSIPSSFKWDVRNLQELNSLTQEEKTQFLKKNEMNIRQCLGEAVPTEVFQSIAKKIKSGEQRDTLSINKVRRLIDKESLEQPDNLLALLSKAKFDFITASKIAELANAKRLENAGYYTRQDLCFNLVSELPEFNGKQEIRILEPAAGVGNFLPTLFAKYRDKSKVNLDLIDIDPDSIRILKRVLKTLKVPSNFEIRIVNDDFLLHDFRNKYDLVVGNPPFGKVRKDKLENYKRVGLGKETKSSNIFALFFEKALNISRTVALFSPKSLLNAPEFEALRSLLEEKSILKISDYGEKGFNGVKIETISLQVQNKVGSGSVIVDSYILNAYLRHEQSYIADKKFPYWLIYRDSYFDNMVNKLELDLFRVYRDRSLTSKNMQDKGKIRVIKSRNIGNGTVLTLSEDKFVDNEHASSIAHKFYNSPNVIIAPNLSYYPRATFLPRNSIVDGSAAILWPKNQRVKISAEDLRFFSSKEYFLFYRVARNFATRSLNIDSNSVYFWGLPKENISYEIFENTVRSKFLFMRMQDAIA